MYTGYYAKRSEYERLGYSCVSIATFAPEWYDGPEYKKISPGRKILSEWRNGPHRGDTDWYAEQFRNNILNNLAASCVVSDLEYIAGVPETSIVLMCYERPGDFCHRHLVAEWLSQNGYACREVNLTVPFGDNPDGLELI